MSKRAMYLLTLPFFVIACIRIRLPLRRFRLFVRPG